MPLQIFHPTLRQVAYSVQPNPPRYGHYLGGSADDLKLTPAPAVPLHLLFRINLEDPAIGLTLSGVKWLPLLCAIRYGACDLSYRVVSDSEVSILHLEQKEALPDFPTANYPASFEKLPIELATDGYNPDDPRSAWGFSAIFGTAHLNDDQKQQIVNLIRETGEYKEFRHSAEQTPLDFVAGNTGGPFFEFKPLDPCPDAQCSNSSVEGSLRTFALYMAGGAFHETLWGPNHADVQVIYQICPLCQAIHVSSQTS